MENPELMSGRAGELIGGRNPTRYPRNDVTKMRSFGLDSRNGKIVPLLSGGARIHHDKQRMCGCVPASVREGRDEL